MDFEGIGITIWLLTVCAVIGLLVFANNKYTDPKANKEAHYLELQRENAILKDSVSKLTIELRKECECRKYN